ncbi:MAG: hypothetical protein KDA99_11655 [Planctomycetales bacterium]|nr:hypothetical protein [Planctomycetales bacterium]
MRESGHIRFVGRSMRVLVRMAMASITFAIIGDLPEVMGAPLSLSIVRDDGADAQSGRPILLRIGDGQLSDPLELWYLEAYCRSDSTDADWVQHTVIPHRCEVLEHSATEPRIRLRDVLADGLIVEHEITTTEDEVRFTLEAHNPTGRRSEAHWAQPCLRIGDFCGRGLKQTADGQAYVSQCFVFVDHQLNMLPTQPWATNARYEPGQVWCPFHVPREDVNPRPLSVIVPSSGLIGCFSKDQRLICATAWEPYQELFQGVIRCIHADLRLGGLAPGKRLRVQGKIYVVPNDVEKLLQRYRIDFPEHQPLDTTGTIQTAAGTGTPDVCGQPFGVEPGPDGMIYICEVENHRVMKLDPRSGRLAAVAGSGMQGYRGDGGHALQAELNEPYEVRFDRDGNMYFVEMRNHVVRRVEQQSNVIATVAGTGSAGYSGDGGPATSAQLSMPHSIVIDDDNVLYIADIGNHRIRRVDLTTGRIETLAGTGETEMPLDGQIAKGSPILGPRALFLDGRTLWIALREGHSVWKMDLDRGRLWHVAGTGQRGYSGDGGPAGQAQFDGPKGIALDPFGNIVIVDTENQVLRRIAARTGIIQTIAGGGPTTRGYGGDDGPAIHAQLDRPHGVGIDPQGRIFVGDTNNHRVRVIDATR